MKLSFDRLTNALVANFRNTLNKFIGEVEENFTETVGDLNKAKADASAAVAKADEAKGKAESVQEQFNQVVIEGDSSVEAAQARVDAKNVAQPTLKARLDNDYNEVTAQLAEKAQLDDLHGRKINVMFPPAPLVGVKGDADTGGAFYDIPVGTDDTIAFNNLIEFAIANSFNIHVPKANYLVKDTIKVLGRLSIYCEVGALFVGYIKDKAKPVFRISGNNRSKIENLRVSGKGYLPLAGIQLTKEIGDNQALEFINARVNTCRHGIFVNEGECINRIVFNRCDLGSNLIAGVYIDSYPTGGYSQSGPITFIHTICNGNGVPTWIADTTQYDGVTILNSTDKFGYQLFVKGFVNLSFIGGQLSDHSDNKLISLGTIRNGSGLSIIGTDIEAIKNPVRKDGSSIADFTQTYEPDEGSAINIFSVEGVKFSQSHAFAINTQSFIKFANQCRNVDIDATTSTGSRRFEVDVAGALTGVSTNLINLYYQGDVTNLSATAFSALNKSDMSVLTHVNGGLTPSGNLDWLFTKSQIGSRKFAFGYMGADAQNPNFENGCYIEKEINSASVIYSLLECTTNSFTPTGLFFIEAIDGNGDRLGFITETTRGGADINGKFYKNVVYTLPNETRRVKYGFINSADSTGFIPDHARVSGFTVYAGYKNPMLKHTSLHGNATEWKQINTLNKNMDYGSTIPTSGTYPRGFIRYNSAPTAGGYLGWVCTTSGSPGTWKGFGLIES